MLQETINFQVTTKITLYIGMYKVTYKKSYTPIDKNYVLTK